MEQLTYNYLCINGNCTTNRLKVRCKDKDKPLCEECGTKLKRLGVCTHILHRGTQESRN